MGVILRDPPVPVSLALTGGELSGLAGITGVGLETLTPTVIMVPPWDSAYLITIRAIYLNFAAKCFLNPGQCVAAKLTACGDASGILIATAMPGTRN